MLDILQVYQSTKSTHVYHIDYVCPLKYFCDCPVRFQVRHTREYTTLRACHEHKADSHAQSKAKYLSSAQKAGLRRATKCAITESARQIRRNTLNFSPQSKVPPDLLRSAQRVVSKQRHETLSAQTKGITLDGKEGPMHRLAQELDFERLLARHNDPADPYHMGLHEVVCTGFQWEKGITFMTLTTPHLSLHYGRAIQSEWEIELQTDGSFNFCDKEFGLIAIGVNSLRSIFRQISFSIVPSESAEAFMYSYRGGQQTFFRFCKDYRLCPPGTTQCQLCDMVRDIVSSPDVKKLLKPGAREKLPIAKALCDNSLSFAKFARKELPQSCTVLQCSAHITGA